MPDNLDATVLFPFAIPVMKFEPVGGEEIAQTVPFDLRVVIARDENHVALFSETGDEREKFAGGCFIVNEIAQQDQSRGVIIVQQLAQSSLD
jgi:hypothetical protein